MVAYKKQHWLPASYLMFFAVDGNMNGRSSRVWVTDGDKKFTARVSDVAVSSWTYSRSDATAAEESFQEMEAGYPGLVGRVTTRSRIGQRDQLLLLTHMVELHFRNAKYDIADGHERLDTYRKWSGRFMQNDMAGFTDEDPPTSMQALADGLSLRWATAVAQDPQMGLIACDNPSFFHEDRHGQLAIVFLPITPEHLAICYRKDAARLVSSTMTADEVSRVNELMAAQCIRHVVSSDEPDADNIAMVKRLRSQYAASLEMTVGWMKPGFWRDFSPMPSFLEITWRPGGGGSA